MAHGDGKHDEALIGAWKAFCARLQAAGEQAFKDHNPASPLQRADAFRFLMQNLGQAFDLALETRDPRFPILHQFCSPLCKLGGDAADYAYQQAWIDGDSVYRIAGSRGTVRFLNFTVQGPRPERMPSTGWPSLHEPFGDLPQANLPGDRLVTADDGSFELFIGGPERERNWLPTTPETRKLFVRQGFDRWDEEPARFTIERLGMREPRPMPTPQTVIEAMDWAGEFVTGVMRDWPDHPYRYSPASTNPSSPNVFPPEEAGDDGDADRRRGRAAVNMCWKLAPDECLIIEFDDHDGFWSLTNMGSFFSSMDYLYRPVSYTPSRARVDGDGKLRFVLAHDDPGYHNWLDTQGFALGNVTYRNMPGTTPTELRTRLVKRTALADAMPADAARATPQDRVAQLLERFEAIRRQRFGL